MINEIINKYNKLGVRLWCEGGKLHYKAPQGTLDKNALNEIKNNKNEIMMYLYKEKCTKLEKIAKTIDNVKNAYASKLSDSIDDDRIELNIQLSKDDVMGIEYDYKELNDVCFNAGENSIGKVDRNLINQWVDTAEHAALCEIMNLFRKKDVFIDNDNLYTADEIVKKIGICDKYERFLRRWLYIFTCEGILIKSENGYSMSKEYDKDFDKDFDSKEGWGKLYELEDKLNYGRGFVNYLKKCCENLEELFKSEVSPLELLFPHGDTNVAVDTYQNTLTSKTLNKIASECASNLVQQCSNKDEVFKILEIGAGVGGTSDSVIEKLTGQNIEYYYTDVSAFFLNNAKKRYEGRENIKYGLFDINKGINQEIVKDKKFDLIICANVLHNAKNVPEILRLMKSLSVDNGASIILDAIREPYYFLTSIEFNDGLRDFEDCRKKDDATFFERDQWMDMFAETGIDVIASLPEKSEEWYKFGQGIFIVNLNKKVDNTISSIRGYLSENINSEDFPYKIKFSKYEGDNKDSYSISKDVNKENNINDDYEKPIGDIECKLESIWCSVLNKDAIGRNENFFLIGGDSLLVSQVIAKMWQEIPETSSIQWGDIMKEILENPTIAQLAEKIKAGEAEEKITKFECVHLLKADKENDKASYVLFHAGTGTLTPYLEMVDLIKKAGCNRDVFGFTYLDYEEYNNLNEKKLFKTLGKKYAKELLKQDKKKFILVGHCIGGLIALEAAKELQKNSVEVEKVVLISTNLFNRSSYETDDISEFSKDIILERVFGTLIGADIKKAGYVIDDMKLKSALKKIKEEKNNSDFEEEDLCTLSSEFEEVSKCYRKLLESTHRERLMNIYNTLDKYDESVVENRADILETVYNIFKHNFLGTLYYEPSLYEGKVNVLKCQEETENFFINISDEFSNDRNVWSKYLDESMSFSYIEGDHISCMNTPHIQKNLNKIVNDIDE